MTKSKWLAGLLMAGVAAPAAVQSNATAGVDGNVLQEIVLEDIVVTATRRDSRLQDVPISVSAVTGDALLNAGITDTRQLTQAIPALNFSRSNSAFQPTIRGVGTRGNGAGDESNVAVYIDGVYQPELSSLSFDLINIDRVEVLRGPQGTLFGRNSTGGLINIITSDPSHETAGNAIFRYGKFNERSGQVYLTTGLSDKVAVDFSGLARKDDGYIKDLVRGGKVGDRESYAVRSKILFEPNDSSRFVLTGAYSDVADNGSVNSQPLAGNTQARSLAINPSVLLPTEPQTSALTLVRELTSKQASAALEARFDLDGVALEGTTAYQHNEVVVETDNDATTVDIGRTHTEPESEYYSQEVRLLSTGDAPLSWITGLFLFGGEGKFNPIISTTNGTTNSYIRTRQRVQSAAGFGEATYEFAEDWKLVGGLRYTTETRKFDGNTQRNGVVLSSVSGAKSSFDEMTYRVILQRDFGKEANLFASYSRGFKSGVFNAFSSAPTSKATDPEVLDAYEVGLKTDPLPWLRANFSAFHYNYKDIQLSARDNNTNLIVLLNAAKAAVDGAEAELTARPADGLNLRAYATWLDGKYKDFPGAQIFVPVYQNQTAIGGSAKTPVGNSQVIADMSGYRMVRAPKYTLGFSFDYTIETEEGDFGITGNLFRSGKYYWDVNNRLAQPGYTQLNGELSYTLPSGDVRFSLWGQNLTNEVIFQQMLPSATADVVSYERPRSYGVALQIRY